MVPPIRGRRRSGQTTPNPRSVVLRGFRGYEEAIMDLTPSELLDELLDCPSSRFRFTDWEINFLESLNRKRKEAGRGWSPTPKQLDTMTTMWEKMNGGRK